MPGYVDIGGVRWLLTPGKSKGIVLLSPPRGQEMPRVDAARIAATASEATKDRGRRRYGRAVRTRTRELREWLRVRVRRLCERRWMRGLLSWPGRLVLAVLTAKVVEWL